jgi:hypothetical protein
MNKGRESSITLFQFTGLTVMSYLIGCLLLAGLCYAIGE